MLAYAFPGQGSQYPGMGKSLLEAYPEVEDVLRRADGILGRPISRLLFDATEEELRRTRNTHPAIFLYSAALYEAVRSVRPPDVVLGHSLGEFAALYAAGVLDFRSALNLVVERGRIIEENTRREGSMVALIGENVLRFAEEVLNAIRSKTLVIANYNSPRQVVISGYKVEVDRALEMLHRKARRLGAHLRAIRLRISFASHSPAVEEASERFASLLDGVKFGRPRVPVILGTTGKATMDEEEIRAALRVQLHSSVRFVDMIDEALRIGVREVWEVGPGKVLSSLIRQITDRVRVRPLDPSNQR
ncbi:MAG: acyltransferase domain-containing protein [Thermotogae bacterium]|nr:acyltransferase domain-containing protein [Thermotogota bacterium]